MENKSSFLKDAIESITTLANKAKDPKTLEYNGHLYLIDESGNANRIWEPNRQAESPGGRSAMKITHVFPDGTRTPDINGLRVPYTAQTAAAYQAVAAAQHPKKEEHTDED